MGPDAASSLESGSRHQPRETPSSPRDGSVMKRRENEPPSAVSRRGWKYHHLGIPTSASHAGERYVPSLKLHVAGFDTSPYGIEWMRFEPGCDVHDLVRTVPHAAFEVDSIEEAIKGCTVLAEANSPSPGVRVAMIVDDGAPVELIEFSKKRRRTAHNPRRARRRSTARSGK